VCLNIEAADYHPGRRHQHRSQTRAEASSGSIVALPSSQLSLTPMAWRSAASLPSAAGSPTAPVTAALPRVARTQRGSRNRAKAAACWPESTIAIASIRRSFLHEVSSQLAKTTAGWP
jgi:putative transposase